ncbi:MAG: TolC family protein, partial [Litorimonas sp.]
MRPFRSAASAFAIGAMLLAAPAYAQTSPDTAPPPMQDMGDSLQSVLVSVYRNNPRLQAERARLRQVDESYIQARAQGRPTLSASGQASLEALKTPRTEPTFFDPDGGGGWETGTPRSAQIVAIQPLYQGGRVRALKQQARADILAARAGLEDAENSIFLSAANAYVDVL